MLLFVIAGGDLHFYLFYLPCGLKELVKALTEWSKMTYNYFFSKRIYVCMQKKVLPNQINCSWKMFWLLCLLKMKNKFPGLQNVLDKDKLIMSWKNLGIFFKIHMIEGRITVHIFGMISIPLR